MADQTPLLLPHDHKSPASSVDETIEYCIGSTGPRQLLQATLVVMAWIFDAQQTFINVFTDAEPKWHCINPTNQTICSSSLPNPCGLPPGSWEWDHPKSTSILSEFGIACAGPTTVGLPASSYFAGCLAGGLLLATLADSHLGRKNMLFLSTLTMSIAAALTSLCSNLWAYSALRFACGFARATVGTSALVLSTETVGRRWRDRISAIGFFFFTLGFLSLPGMAYLGRGSSWRNLYLWTSVPSFVYSISIYFLTNESPRWLLVRGRKVEAIHMLKKTAAENGNININSSFSTLLVVDEGWNIQVFSSMRVLYEKKWALRRLTAVMIVGFGVGMIYYGMPLNLGNLGPNLYISVTLNALAELPSSLIIFFFVGGINRRCSMLVLTTVSGVCSVLCVFLVAKGLLVVVEVMAFFCALTAFSMLLIYSIELFPTCVRNTAISMVRQALVFGGVFAPILVAAGRKRSFLSFGVFGLVMGCCGLFAVCLPETRGSTISDTLEEEEYKENVSYGSSTGA